MPDHASNRGWGPCPNKPNPRLLLVGDPAARPEGLERFLVRAGFQVTEAPYPPPVADRPDQNAPDLLIFAVGARDARLAEAVRALATAPRFSAAPVIVLVAGGGAGGVAGALPAGAPGGMASAVHFGARRARG